MDTIERGKKGRREGKEGERSGCGDQLVREERAVDGLH